MTDNLITKYFYYGYLLQQSSAPQQQRICWQMVLRSVSKVNEKQVAQRIADESTLNPKEAEMAIYQLLKVLKLELLNGNTVELGD